MAKDTTETQKRIIQAQGFGLSGGIRGGPKKTKYWTPDGRVILAPPSLRGFVRKDLQGKVIDSGTRDANLDKGWLLTEPTELKVRCPHCDKWHDTEEDVHGCGVSMGAFVSHHAVKAKEEFKIKEMSDIQSEVDELKTGMDEIKELLKEVLKRGAIF